jgi:hypothetical protein
MSYCGPFAISDYNYRRLYEDQMRNGQPGRAEAAPVLLVRALLSPDAAPVLQPTYALRAPLEPVPAASRYRIALLDATRNLIAEQPVALTVAQERDFRVETLATTIRIPERPVAAIQLLDGDSIIAEQFIAVRGSTSAEALQAEPNGSSGIVWGQPDVPTLVRYSDDDGQTWTTIGVDIVGGKMEGEQVAATPGRLFEVHSALDQSTRGE